MDNNKSIFIDKYYHNKDDIVDCHIMHLKDICMTLGVPISGEMCFGIGEGYNFEYWLDSSSKIPCLIMLGRKIDQIYTFMNKFGISYKVEKIFTELDFENYVENNIKSKQLPLVYADRYHLRYLEQMFNRAHFGNHIFSINGIKKVDNKVSYAVCDVISNDIIWCDSSEIQMARSSEWKPFSPDFTVINVDLNNSDVSILKNNLPIIIIDSIKQTINNMLNKEKCGVRAIEALAFEVKDLLNADFNKFSRALAFQMKLLSSFIKEFEETHSFYRMTYAAFLEEAARDYCLDYLLPYAYKMKQIANEWIQMSDLLTSYKSIEELLNEFGNRLKIASDLEKNFFEDLKATIYGIS